MLSKLEIQSNRDKDVTSNMRSIGLGALAAGAALFLAGALAGQRVEAHPPEQHTDPVPQPADPQTRVLDLSSLSGMDALIGKLNDRRVVFVGETHDRYEHHLNQLKIIQGLYAQDSRLVIGLEFFQQPFQTYLDRYVAGEIDERAFLVNSEYFERWRYDYRLYRPIMRFAREQGIPLIALNVPRELTRKVSQKGLEGLDEADKAQVPADIDRDDAAYRQRIKQVFDAHPGAGEKNFENFLDAQLLWDEGMAERAAHYLKEYPNSRMVVLAGTGHLVYGQGIPNRLLRREPVSSAIVLNSAHHELDPTLADFLLFPQRIDLPRSGLLGVFLDTEGDGVSIKGFSDGSPAKTVGLKKGDRILTIAGLSISSYTDIRVSLMDHKPGDSVPVEVLRDNLIMEDERLSYTVELF